MVRDFTLRGKRLQVICLVLLLAVLAGAAFLFYRENRVAAVVTLEPFNFRSGPDAGSALLGESEAGGVYPVLERRSGGGTIYGKRWFKVRLDGGGEAYLVDASNSSQQQLNHTEFLRLQAWRLDLPLFVTERRDTFFDTLLEFPADYHEGLLRLHFVYPNWTFEALPVGRTWPEVLAAQTTPENKNLVQYEETAFFSDYEWMVKNRTVYDGSNWYPATEEAIAFFMDPRNFLNPGDLFQFLDLRYGSGERTDRGVRAIFADNQDLLELVPAVMRAARESDVLPEALAARIRQEVSTESGITLVAKGLLDPSYPPLRSGSPSPSLLSRDEQIAQLDAVARERPLDETERVILESLRTGGPGYPSPASRYYNLYNIGAYPDPGVISGAQMNGARYAAGLFVDKGEERFAEFLLPWTDPERAARGGARFLAADYISIGQDTAYLQKFDLVTGSYSHQYMQALFAARDEGRRLYAVWQEGGDSTAKLHFRIPVFRDLPTSTGKDVR